MAVKSKEMHKKPLSKYILKLCQFAAAELNPFTTTMMMMKTMIIVIIIIILIMIILLAKQSMLMAGQGSLLFASLSAVVGAFYLCSANGQC